MTAKENDQDLLKRLRELEEENARQRTESVKEESKLIVTEGEYKGFPTLTFEGSARRFSLGLTKLRALQEAWPQVEEFLQRYGRVSAERSIDNDFRI